MASVGIVSSAQVLIGRPPNPVLTSVENTPSGIWPDTQASIFVNWTAEDSPATSYFNVWVRIDGGPWQKHNTSNIEKNLRRYNYGFVDADKTYEFYVEAASFSSISSISNIRSIRLASPAPPSATAYKDTRNNGLNVSMTAGSFALIRYQSAATSAFSPLSQYDQNPAEGATSNFRYEQIAQNTTRVWRVQGRNRNGHWSNFSSNFSITTNIFTAPTISWEDTNPDKFSSWRVSWTGASGIGLSGASVNHTYVVKSKIDSAAYTNLNTGISGSGTKFSSFVEPTFEQTASVFVECTDQFGAVSNTNTRTVKCGRPSLSSWGPESANIVAEFSSRGNSPNWGNISRVSLVTSSTVDYNIVRREIIGSSLDGLSVTSTSRRLRFRWGTEAAERLQDFDSSSITQNKILNANTGWSTSEGQPLRTYVFGLSDMPTFLDGAVYRYTGTTQADFWSSTQRSEFRMIYTYRSKNFTETQTRIATTYS
jgi:hypothetical protein